MQKTVSIGALVLLIVAIATAFCFAAGKVKPPKLAAVTVAVQGVQRSATMAQLKQELAGITGVSDVKATLASGRVTAKLDEKKIDAARFVQTAEVKLAKIETEQPTAAQLVVFIDTAMCAGQEKMCQACFDEIPNVLKGISGIKTVTLDETGKVATVAFDRDAKVTTSMIEGALKKSTFGFTTRFMEPTQKSNVPMHGMSNGACH